MKLSIKMWVGVGTLFITVMLACASLATPSWISGVQDSSDISVGIWRACMDLTCVSVFDDDKSIVHTMGTWLYLVQVGSCLGFAVFVLSLLGTMVVYNREEYRGRYGTLQFIAILIFVGVLCYGYATFLYGFKCEKLLFNSHSPLNFGMAFYMGVSAVMLGLAASIIYYMEYKDQTNVRSAYMVLN